MNNPYAKMAQANNQNLPNNATFDMTNPVQL